MPGFCLDAIAWVINLSQAEMPFSLKLPLYACFLFTSKVWGSPPVPKLIFYTLWKGGGGKPVCKKLSSCFMNNKMRVLVERTPKNKHTFPISSKINPLLEIGNRIL